MRRALGGTAGVLVAWIALALVDSAVIGAGAAWPIGGAPVRLAHHYYDAAHDVALGLVSAALVLAWRRLGPRRPAWRPVALAALALALVWLVGRDDLANAAERFAGEGRDALPFLVALCAAAAVPIPAAHLAGRALARPRWRWLAVGVAASAGVANGLALARAYPGLHFLTACAAVTLASSALAGCSCPALSWLRPRAFVAGALAFVLPSIVLWPRDAVVIELLRTPGAILAPYLARAWFEDESGRPITGPDRAWFAPRDSLPPVPPTSPPLLPADGIVIVLSIDAVRADVLWDPAHARHLPALSALRREGVSFREARATGSQTVYTMTDLFSGKYFSQQYWSMRGRSKGAQYWPWRDRSVHFPELLAKAGVATVTWPSAWWMSDRVGIARGFQEQTKVKTADKTPEGFPYARELMDALLLRLVEHRGGPLFVFVHFMDPHYPYNRSGLKKVSRFRKYVGEVALVDAQIARLIEVLRATGQWDRTAIVVMSDHGEAFGEHDTTMHGVTIYEELLRVPLVIRAPGAVARVVDEPVSTIDLGPTILDLFGQPTPGHFMGQSLVPLLRGEDAPLTRPIVAETRLKQALVTRDGMKAIRDLRNGTREVYDLRNDRGETRNLYGLIEGNDAMNRLRRFFDVHTYRAGGYSPPWRP